MGCVIPAQQGVEEGMGVWKESKPGAGVNCKAGYCSAVNREVKHSRLPSRDAYHASLSPQAGGEKSFAPLEAVSLHFHVASLGASSCDFRGQIPCSTWDVSFKSRRSAR